ncbi:MAG TPA: TAXI family TRAP transporter solute-binding subunit, partial [Gemmatimonadaceae bacterium]|nr:TAXI family TRAP transporter solute-binding subunit [Gemmatimonadaceae bacterium]
MFSAVLLVRPEGARRAAKRWRIAAALVGVFSLGAGSCDRHTPAPPLKTLTFAVGNREGSFYALGDAMAKAYEESIPNLEIHVQPTSGAVDTMHAIEQGTVDAGLSLANQSYAAVGGHLSPDFRPFTQLRGIAVLEVTPIHLVAGPHTTIRSVGDLRGRRLSIIPNSSTSGTYLAAEVILKSHGLSVESVQLNLMDYSDSVAHLLAGTLDALFVTGAYPIERVTAAMQGGS